MARSRGVYNKIYTPELWDKVNPENKAILQDFLDEYRQQKKAQSTITAYYQDARIALIYILRFHGNKSLLSMSKKDFRNYSLWLSDDCKLSANRVNRLKATVNSIMEFVCNDDDYDIEVNFAKKVKGLPRERVKTNDDDFFFTFEEFIAVRNKLVEMGDLQTAVLWSISFDSAGRRNEIFQIKKEGLLDGNKTNIVRGKRGKMFPLIYLDDTKELIRQYLEQRGDDDIESLWYAEHGGKRMEVTKDALYNRFIKCSKILSEIRGQETNIFPHSARHSRFNVLKNGGDSRLQSGNGENRVYDLNEIKLLAHHESSQTTEMYLKDNTEEMIDSLFGVGKSKNKSD